MRILVDTNRYVDFCMGVAAVVETLERANAVHLPFVTLAELRAGFRCGTVGRRNEAVWVRFLANPHDLLLCSRDSHFDKLPQLARC